MLQDNNINVNIPNVVAWFTESEQCMLHNHAEEIPNSLLNSPKPSLVDIHSTLIKFAVLHANDQITFFKELETPIDSFPLENIHE